ncbi:MAG: ATP/GTP-binding protein, partial [Mesorhizobium sp.]
MNTLIASTVIAVAGIAAAPAAQAGELWRAAGFEQPESVLADAAHNRIVVSNIAGDPGA